MLHNRYKRNLPWKCQKKRARRVPSILLRPFYRKKLNPPPRCGRRCPAAASGWRRWRPAMPLGWFYVRVLALGREQDQWAWAAFPVLFIAGVEAFARALGRRGARGRAVLGRMLAAAGRGDAAVRPAQRTGAVAAAGLAPDRRLLGAGPHRHAGRGQGQRDAGGPTASPGCSRCHGRISPCARASLQARWAHGGAAARSAAPRRPAAAGRSSPPVSCWRWRWAATRWRNFRPPTRRSAPLSAAGCAGRSCPTGSLRAWWGISSPCCSRCPSGPGCSGWSAGALRRTRPPLAEGDVYRALGRAPRLPALTGQLAVGGLCAVYALFFAVQAAEFLPALGAPLAPQQVSRFAVEGFWQLCRILLLDFAVLAAVHFFGRAPGGRPRPPARRAVRVRRVRAGVCGACRRQARAVHPSLRPHAAAGAVGLGARRAGAGLRACACAAVPPHPGRAGAGRGAGALVQPALLRPTSSAPACATISPGSRPAAPKRSTGTLSAILPICAATWPKRPPARSRGWSSPQATRPAWPGNPGPKASPPGSRKGGMPSTRGQPHAPRLPQTSVGADSISARFAAAQTPTGGMNPAPAAHGQRPANRGGRGCPGKRRGGMPSSRRTLRRRAPQQAPLSKGGESGDRRDCFAANFRFFKRQPAAGQSLRHGLRPCHLPLTREAKWSHSPRPTACPTAAATPCRGRFHIGPVWGGANTRGRAMARPYDPRPTSGQPGRPRLPGQT